jgi:hypothetical protein
MRAGAPVELRDQVARWGEHDRIQSTTPIGTPRLEEVFGDCCQVADMDALSVEVEAQRLWPAGPQRQRRGGFGWVVESV